MADSFLKVLCESIDAASLPVAVCVMGARPSNKGVILYGNERFLKITGPDCEGRRIFEFGESPKDREKLESIFDEIGKSVAHEQELSLKGHCRTIKTKHVTRGIFDKAGSCAGAVSCLIECSSREVLHESLGKLPVGLFHMNEEGLVEFASQGMLGMFGSEASDPVLGRPFRDLCVSETAADLLRDHLESSSSVLDLKVQFRRNGGENFVGNVAAARLPVDPSERYVGLYGAVTGIEKEETYIELVRDLPFGLFSIRSDEEGASVIEHCNSNFALMVGFESTDDLAGRQTSQVFAAHQEKDWLTRMVDDRSSDTSQVTISIPSAPVGRGERWLRINSKRVLTEGGARLIGLAMDITEQYEIEEWASLLRGDIGNFVHSYSSSLMAHRHALDVAMDYLRSTAVGEGRPSDGLPSPEALDQLADNLEGHLGHILELRHDDHASMAFSTDDWDLLRAHHSTLLERLSRAPTEFRQVSISAAAADIQQILRGAERGFFKRTTLKKAMAVIDEIRRISTMSVLMRAGQRVLELGGELDTIKSVIVTGQQESSEIEEISVNELIRIVADRHLDFAQSESVVIRTTCLTRDRYIRGYREELLRAMSNVVHNAVKYSWRQRGKSYVLLRATRREDHVELSVENLGVPIPSDEIDLVCGIGFRGRYSSDRRRSGSGIGLWDAKRVARRHQARLEISSRPVRDDLRHESETPHLTTVNLCLPLSGTTV